jgi:Carboxypeptidase regulatory-like domain/TonB dependent receptor
MIRPCLAVWLALAASAAAQTTGGISGRIVDAQSGKPVAGAIIAAASSSMPGEETARSDPQGEFEIGLLLPGIYTLSVQAEAHQSFTQDGLAVHAGRTIRVYLSIDRESAVSAPFRFAQEPPVLPVTSAQGGAVISREQMELVPYGRDERSFEPAAASAPGVLTRPLGLEILGSPASGTRYRIDGVDVTDPASNRQGRRLVQQFIEEVNVDSTALGASYGRVAGGVVQAITRSGGSELHGSAFVDWMPIEIPRRTLRYNLAGGAELGGPIARDSLWFYGGFAPVLMATHSGVQTDYQYISKVTWRPEQGHLLSVAAISDDFSVHYLGDLLDRTAQVEAVTAWHRQRSDAESLQARVQVAHLAELAGRHRFAWGAEGVRDSAGISSRWYGGAFAEDAWSPVQSLFIDAGVRLERDELVDNVDVLPRVGVAWDFSGRGASRAYAFVGRFFESPELASQRRTREHQLAAGVQSQIFRDVVAGLDYVHKDFRDAPDGRSSYDAATFSLAKPFSASSLLQASYTHSSLRGAGAIAADAPNVIKLDAAYAYEWDAKTTATLGTSFQAIDGSPWQVTLDLRAGVVRALTSPYVLTVTADVLNLFDRERGGTPPLAGRFSARLAF